MQWIYVWALLGVIAAVLQLNAYGRWILSPDFRPTEVGSDPIPEFSRISMTVYQWLSIITLVFVIPWFVRGIRQQGRIDATRLMMMGWLSAYWLDPFLSFLTPMFTYNASMVNFGCWCEFIPGWQTYNGRRLAEPLLVDGPAYFYTFTGTAIMGLWAMRKAQARWPGIGTVGLMLCAYPAIWIGMGALDVVATRYMHFDAWPGSLQSASLWGGQFYQFPIYEFILFPTPFVLCALLLLRTNSQGHTWIERGIEQLSITKLMTALRVLAFMGFCNLLNFGYTAAMGVYAYHHADRWPQSMPSWLANEQCGGDTGIACAAKK
jgi:hypothetical protein